MLAGSMAVAAIFALVLNCAVREHRWQKSLKVLVAEPGIHVVRESSAWGRREVTGFYDPLAREPEQVLASAGLNPEGIAFMFKPYFSAEPLFALARQPTPTESRPVVISTPKPEESNPEPGKDKLKRAAPEKLVEKARPVETPPPAKAPKLIESQAPAEEPKPGEARKASETSQPTSVAAKPAEAALPEQLMQLKTGIEAIKFHFEPNSETLLPESEMAMKDTAKWLGKMQQLADTSQLELHVTLRVIQSIAPVRGAVWQLRHSSAQETLVTQGLRASVIEPSVIPPPSSAKPAAGTLDSMSLRITFDSNSENP
jgi:outer membrane biosynthesis protein TonB